MLEPASGFCRTAVRGAHTFTHSVSAVILNTLVILEQTPDQSVFLFQVFDSKKYKLELFIYYLFTVCKRFRTRCVFITQ